MPIAILRMIINFDNRLGSRSIQDLPRLIDTHQGRAITAFLSKYRSTPNENLALSLAALIALRRQEDQSCAMRRPHIADATVFCYAGA